MESAIRGQLGLLSAARSATLGSSVIADMDASFLKFDRMSVSSCHAEHFGFLMMQRLTSKASECHKGEFGF
jgi:hypothetical protein